MAISGGRTSKICYNKLKMRKVKKILAFSTVLVSLVVSVFLIRDGFDKKAVSQFADLGQNAPIENFPLLNVNFENTLTGTYIQKLTESLQAANPNGFPIINDNPTANVPDVTDINQWLERETANINIDSLKPVINDNDLRISEDQSTEAIANYVTQYNLIFEKHFNSLPVNINLNVDTATLDDFMKLLDWVSEQFKKINKDLIVLPAPKNIISLHKDLIRNNAAEAALYDLIVNYQRDPLRAMAITPLRNQIIKEKQEIRTNFANFLKTQ